MPARHRKPSRIAWTSIASLLVVAGCTQLETDRIAAPRTLGSDIFEVLCQRVAAEELPNDVSGSASRAPCKGESGSESVPTEAPRLRVLVARRARMVEALDALLPASLESDLHRFMVELVPFYDAPNPYLPELTRATALFLEALGADDEALSALSRLSARRGYAPSGERLGIMRPLFAHADLDTLLKNVLTAVAPGGNANAPFEALLRALAFEAATARPPTAEGEESTLALARTLLFSEDPVYGSRAALPLVVRDPRGWALPRVLEAPFADRDGDGLADVDEEGRFTDASGAPLDLASPFPRPRETASPRDALGRALRDNGTPLYRTRDLDRTLLAGLLREAQPLLGAGEGHLLDVLSGLRRLLGPDRTREKVDGTARLSFVGFDTDRGPLFDLLHAVAAILPAPETDDALVVVERLLRDHESVLAGVVDAAFYVDARSDRAPGDDAHLEPNSELWDDVLDVLARISREPGLTEAVLRAIGDPGVARLGPIFSEQMRYRDEVKLDPETPATLRRAIDFTLPVDRSAPNRHSNASIFQRNLAIIHDLSGVRLCNKPNATLSVYGNETDPDPVFVYPFFGGSYPECDLLEVEDLVYFYAQSALGLSELRLNDELLNGLFEILRALSLGGTVDDIFVSLTGIDGFDLTPTPEAIHRFIHGPWNRTLGDLLDPVTTRDGAWVKAQHPEQTLVSWEREYLFCPGNVRVSHAAMNGPTPPCSTSEVERLTFVDALVKILEAFENYDRRNVGTPIDPREANVTRRLYLFGELITALHLHWATPEHDKSQSRSTNSLFFSFQSGASRYEPILADAFAECLAESGGVCTERGGNLLRRLHDLVRTLETIELRPGIDGVGAMARLLELMVDPERHPELRDRAGRRTTTTNAGRRTLSVSPIYLLLDSLNAMDRAFETDPDVHARWLAARSRMVDGFLSTQCSESSCRFASARTREGALAAIDFLRTRVDVHRQAGDLENWAASLPSRLAETLDDPLPASTLRLLDALATDTSVRPELEKLLGGLLSTTNDERELRGTLLTAADVLQWAETIEPRTLARALAHLVASNAGDVRTGSAPKTDDGAVHAALDLVRGVLATDHPERRVLRTILARLVAPSLPEDESPLEAIVDVLVDVHRAGPRIGSGRSLSVDDASTLLERTQEFLNDEFRGLERLYRVVNSRTLEAAE